MLPYYKNHKRVAGNGEGEAMNLHEAKTKVCDEILDIMKDYHEQEDAGNIGTPGGLEHMGDVWRLLRTWEKMLKP